jgi:hypothetical protein
MLKIKESKPHTDAKPRGHKIVPDLQFTSSISQNTEVSAALSNLQTD